MGAKREEIRDDDDALGATRDEKFSGAGQIGYSKLKKRGLDCVIAGTGHLRGNLTHGLIGAFDARAVSEDNEAGHTRFIPG